MKALWQGHVIAESDETIIIEGNHYFPPASVKADLLKPSAKVTTCPWKGQATYRTISVDGHENTDAAWLYESPKTKAQQIKGYFAFWKGVTVEQ